ncbi:MAG: hypothetical protein HYV63_22065 [Candidatus Schekmanbacteria bacterium]|nr:hypothetical protein [Candidatus Schekmanbacteria bacterium]
MAFFGARSGATAAADGWELKADTDDIRVYSREVEGTRVRQMKAVGQIDAPPARVLAVVADAASYRETMPYTEESQVVRTEGSSLWFYTVINAPLVSRRDYCIRITVSDLGGGVLRSRWVPANDYAPPKAPDVVRVEINDGHWLLTPRDGGQHTETEYFLFTDPGGSIPTFVANKANSVAVPDVFRAIRRAVRLAKYAAARLPDGLTLEAAASPNP